MSTPAPRTLIEHPSPNYDARDAQVPLRFVVIHYTGMKTGAAALQRLCDPAAKVSAHYLIEEDGSLFRLVAEDQRAWHAGVSSWQGITDMNSASIGIELVNPGHEHGYRRFPAAQIETLIDMLNGVVQRHGMDPLRCMLGHSDIAPTRKEDPGELFPWQELAEAGYGLWPQIGKAVAGSDGEARRLLGEIGYDCSDLPATLRAFQRRYQSEDISGKADGNTVGLLQALKQLQQAASA